MPIVQPGLLKQMCIRDSLEDASRFNDTFLANPFFQQLHVIQPLFSLFGEIPVRGR